MKTNHLEKNLKENDGATQAVGEYLRQKAEERFQSVDVLEELRRNIRQLDSLSGRLDFMMSEIRQVLKKY